MTFLHTLSLVSNILQAIENLGAAVLHALPLTLALGALFPLLTYFSGGNADGPWWRKPEIVTDLCYWFFLPLIGSFMRTGFLIVGAVVVFGVRTQSDLRHFFEGGFGPFAGLPVWAQVGVYLILADVMLYWTHRLFHGESLWKYHAVHHSSEHVDWISATRFHPVNIIFHSVLVDAVLLLAGIAPEVLILLAPFNVAMSAFVHANLNWTMGPLKYVIAGPVFHRWHHTDVARGGEKNFAPTLPILDVIFGTFYMPEGVLPDAFGVDDEHFPDSFLAQMFYPFRRKHEQAPEGIPQAVH
jgi:sterol desaturase/sphingolipid hydroxylase (fatty acid hydroxylase superfamily)